MLKSIIQVKDKDGKTADYLNSLRRWVMSGVIVPTQELAVIKVPAAPSATQPYISSLLPIQGPQDAKTEVYSLIGRQGVTVQGLGTVTTTGADHNVTGSGTKFTTQTQVGDNIILPPGIGSTVTSVISDTLLTTAAIIGANAGVNVFFQTNTNTNKLFMTIQDAAWRRNLMPRDVPVIHVFGDQLKPMFMRETLLLETNQTFLMQFYNYDTANPASFAPTCEGRKWQFDALKRKEVAQYIDGLRTRKTLVNPYWLTLDDGFVTIPAGGSVTKFMTLTGDLTAVFFDLMGTFETTSEQGTYLAPQISLFDAKTQRQLQSDPMTFFTATGSPQNPFVLPTPWIVEPQTQVMVQITNQYTDAPVTVYLTLHGTALYTGINWKGGALMDPAILAESKKMYKEMSIPQIRRASRPGV